MKANEIKTLDQKVEEFFSYQWFYFLVLYWGIYCVSDITFSRVLLIPLYLIAIFFGFVVFMYVIKSNPKKMLIFSQRLKVITISIILLIVSDLIVTLFTFFRYYTFGMSSEFNSKLANMVLENARVYWQLAFGPLFGLMWTIWIQHKQRSKVNSTK